MTRDDIIRMAQEADGHMNSHAGGIDIEWDGLLRFAALVAAAEREACAEVAESYEPTCETCPSGVANAIRARNTEE